MKTKKLQRSELSPEECATQLVERIRKLRWIDMEEGKAATGRTLPEDPCRLRTRSAYGYGLGQQREHTFEHSGVENVV